MGRKIQTSSLTLSCFYNLSASLRYRYYTRNPNKFNYNIDDICAALGISLAEFFTEEEQVLGPEIQRLLGTAKKLSPEQIDYLQKLLESLSKDQFFGFWGAHGGPFYNLIYRTVILARKWTLLYIIFEIFGDWWKEKQEVRRKRKVCVKRCP